MGRWKDGGGNVMLNGQCSTEKPCISSVGCKCCTNYNLHWACGRNSISVASLYAAYLVFCKGAIMLRYEIRIQRTTINSFMGFFAGYSDRIRDSKWHLFCSTCFSWGPTVTFRITYNWLKDTAITTQTGCNDSVTHDIQKHPNTMSVPALSLIVILFQNSANTGIKDLNMKFTFTYINIAINTLQPQKIAHIFKVISKILSIYSAVDFIHVIF